MHDLLATTHVLPADGTAGTLVGRAWVPGDPSGPSVVVVRDDGVFDLSSAVPTMADLLNSANSVAVARADGAFLGPLDAILANSAHDRRIADTPWLLAPVDLQAIKASGVTFATSLLERVIEEQAGGDKARAEDIRRDILDVLGADLSTIEPGSPEAQRLKSHLIEQGAWSQYLEVGIGPDAEIFTKAPAMAAVGVGSEVGIRSDSSWNNPEPEVVMVVAASGTIVGAALGNDVNLRDIEGRSALLLGKAKDNNASAAIGPFIRLLDETLSLDDLRQVTVELAVTGSDGYSMRGENSLIHISRDIEALVGATVGVSHQYPDGFALFTGTMFAPTQDRDEPGEGFTHHVGDVVRISCPELGGLVNRVNLCEQIEPWSFGASALMHNLAARGLLG